MTRSRLSAFLTALLAGLLSGIPAVGHADDTEVYVGSGTLATSSGVRPNILVILDTSGSMSTSVPGTGKDRLDNMKDALKTILGNLSNVNVGLMRFSNPGGPVLYPVAPIEADANVVYSGAGSGLSVRVADGTDDVEELKATGQMDLGGSAIELPSAPGFGAETTFWKRVAGAADDAEERVSNGAHDNDDGKLHLVREDGNLQLVGLRFTGVTVPHDAYVMSADLTFRATDSDSADASWVIQGWDTGNAGNWVTNPYLSAFSIANKPRTDASVSLPGVAPWSEGNDYVSEDIAPVIQEIVSRTDWSSGNALGIILTGEGRRRARSYDDRSSSAPKLTVRYAAGAGGEQLVGLRFRELPIPQGATIVSASLEVSPSRTLSEAVSVRVSAEAVDDAAPFSATEKVSTKLTRATTASVQWDIGSTWTARAAGGEAVESPDLTAVVQEVVNRPGWCGGNDLALMIEKVAGSGWRALSSYEGDAANAPALRVNYTYDVTTAPAGSGCVQQTVQYQVSAGVDDAEQTLSGGDMDLTSSDLDFTSGRANGVRFRDVRIPRSAQITDARLVFAANVGGSTSASWRIRGEAADNALEFGSSDNNLTSRTLTTAAVTWSPVSSWTSGASYETPNLKTVVQEIVDRAGWQSGNAMAFVVDNITGTRAATSHNSSAALAPRLQVTYRGRGAVVTVRSKLIEVVDQLDHQGYTPIVDTLYEGARYFRGEGVLYGLTRGEDYYTQAQTRVSHPGSYTGGTVVRDAGCTDENLSVSACRTETITGNPTYVSPIDDNCGSNYIILLTDGEANSNHSQSLIQTLTGASCQTKLSDGSNVTTGELCGIDLGRFLNSQDQSTTIEGTQTVSVYTIGFNLDSSDSAQAHAIQFLRDLARGSGGQFREATAAADLANTFQAFFLDILNRSTSYASPTLSVNAFSKLYHRDEVYFALFAPSSRAGWKGNVKKYRICTSRASCALGEVLDATGQSALGADGRILDTAQSFWSASPDGLEVDQGGTGNAGPAYGSRRILTFTGATPPAGTPFTDLSLDAHRVVSTNAALTAPMLGLAGTATATERQTLIDWVRGKDVDDEDTDTVTDETRYSFGDPLHSSPVVVTYGLTGADPPQPVEKVFVGTNDGALRMIDGYSGVEEWAFYPPETLANQAALRTNANGPHLYGMDVTPTPWVRDQDDDGVVGDTTGDFVRVIAAMRRGGNRIYALDVTPASPLGTQGQIVPTYPKLMWRIDGSSTGYPRLGQSWSRPLVTKVRVGTSTAGVSALADVVLFGGGYDTLLDTDFNPASTYLGNAIYMADAATGARKLWISGTAHASGDGVLVSGMSYPIPSDLALLDADGDGATDRLYVGDLGGQIWRVDLFPKSGTAGGVQAIVGKLASVSDLTAEADPADRRKFFYPPDVVRVVDPTYSETARYDLVVIASGDREHPLSATVTDGVYAIRDYHPAPLLEGTTVDGYADGYVTALARTAADTDLVDVTDRLTFEGEEAATDLADLKASRGWYLTFEDPGEKGLAPAVTLAGKVYVTTYLPSGVVISDACALAEGAGQLYALNALNATPTFNWDGVGDVGSKDDRTYSLGGGIPSGAAPIFTEEGVTLLIGVGGGAATVDPNLTLPRRQTSWVQEH